MTESNPQWSENRQLVYIDLETTGIDYDKDTILEIGARYRSPDGEEHTKKLIVNLRDSAFKRGETYDIQKMHHIPFLMHTKNGLLFECLHGAEALPIPTADAELARWIIEVVGPHTEYQKPVLAGETPHFDFIFMRKFMPQTTSCLDYFFEDVSTIKRFLRRIFGREFFDTTICPNPNLKEIEELHRALPDAQHAALQHELMEKWVRENFKMEEEYGDD